MDFFAKNQYFHGLLFRMIGERSSSRNLLLTFNLDMQHGEAPQNVPTLLLTGRFLLWQELPHFVSSKPNPLKDRAESHEF
jgi:hypothetical protein